MLHVPREIENETEQYDMRLRDAPGITEGRLDVLFCKPSKLKVEDGYNVRDLTTPEALKELDELEALVKEHGVRTPLKVRFDDAAGDIWVVEGHRRLTVVNRLLEKFRESGGAEGRKIEAVPIIAEPKGTTALDRDFGLRHSNSGTPLKPLEFANLIYRTIHQRGISEKDAAKGFGVSTTVLRNHLKMREMPDSVKAQVNAGDVSATTALKVVKETRDAKTDPEFAAELIRANKEENARIRGKRQRSTKVTQRTIKRDREKAEPIVEVHNEVHTQTPATVKAAEDLRAAVPTPETPVVMPGPEPTGILTCDGPMKFTPLSELTPPPAPNKLIFGCGDFEVFIELTRQAHICVEHNQRDDHPGWWSISLVEAIRKARDVVERLTGAPMEFETIADRSSQEEEAA